jgi:hypothetical protein
MSGKPHTPAALTPRTMAPTEKKARWAPELFWEFRSRESLLYLSGFDPRTVQPAARRCSNWATAAPSELIFDLVGNRKPDCLAGILVTVDANRFLGEDKNIFIWSLSGSRYYVFCGTRRFIAVFTKPRHWQLFWIIRIRSTSYQNYCHIDYHIVLPSMSSSWTWPLSLRLNDYNFEWASHMLSYCVPYLSHLLQITKGN